MKVLYVSSEVVPYAKTGGLADVSGALPPVIKSMGYDIRIILPKYGTINNRKFNIRKVRNTSPIPIQIAGKIENAELKSARLPGTDVRVYFIENHHYFNRPDLYKDPESNKDWKDNDERFLFFSLAVLESFNELDWYPDIIHCNDWQSSLIPLLLKTHYREKTIGTLLSIHNIAYQGVYEKTFLNLWDFPEYLSHPLSGMEYWGKVNLLKAGIVYADIINTVSKSYSLEIQQSEEFGFGLEGVLKDRAKDLYGILNGVDYAVWNPKTDPLIPYQYSLENMAGKRENKIALLKKNGLRFDDDIPLIGIISRLADQKGFDLIAEIVQDLMKLNLQIIVLGTGEQKYHQLFTGLEEKFPEKVIVHLKFDNSLAHQIEAGCDIFLMPSKYEPCGLNQMYSLKYGTVPIIRKTGGLADTVEEYNQHTSQGTGFTFQDYKAESLYAAIVKSLDCYKDKTQWDKLMKNGMKADFSWDRSAREYIKIYESKLNKNLLLPVS